MHDEAAAGYTLHLGRRADPRRRSPGFFTRLLDTLINPNILTLLFLAGLAGIGYEIFHPGVVLPGALGLCRVDHGALRLLRPAGGAGPDWGSFCSPASPYSSPTSMSTSHGALSRGGTDLARGGQRSCSCKRAGAVPHFDAAGGQWWRVVLGAALGVRDRGRHGRRGADRWTAAATLGATGVGEGAAIGASS